MKVRLAKPPVDAKIVERIRRWTETDIDYIDSPEFADPASTAAIVNDLDVFHSAAGRRPAVPEGLPSYFAALYETPLLKPQQEQHLFRQMNYWRSLANRIRLRLNPKRPSEKLLTELEQVFQKAEAVRTHIVQANLRLVVANARLFADVDHPFEDLVSDGNLSLMQAVDKFDYTRGFRFSTYATHAIRRSFYRRITRKRREKTRLTFTSPDIMQEAPQPEHDATADPAAPALYRRLLELLGERLNPREQAIVSARFSLHEDGEPPTLLELSRRLGICKERVRQIQNRALEKLRELSDEIRSEIEAGSAIIP